MDQQSRPWLFNNDSTHRFLIGQHSGTFKDEATHSLFSGHQSELFNNTTTNSFLIGQQSGIFNSTHGIGQQSGLFSNGSFNSLLIARQLFQRAKFYYIPSLVVVGLIGNVLSCTVFLGSSLRKISAVQYLSALTICDAFFLFSLFLMWLKNFGIDLYNSAGWCQFIPYLTSVCNFLSLWYIVGLSVDRYICLCSPARKLSMCTGFRAKAVIISLAILAIVVFLNTSLTYGVVQYGHRQICTLLLDFIVAVGVLNKIDTVINLFIPYIVLLFMITSIARYLISTRNPVWTLTTGDVSSRESRLNTSIRQEVKRDKQTAKLVLVLSLLFICFTLPNHVLRVTGMFRSMTRSGPPLATFTDIICRHVFQELIHISYALKFWVYIICWKSFRKVLVCKTLSRRNRLERKGSYQRDVKV